MKRFFFFSDTVMVLLVLRLLKMRFFYYVDDIWVITNEKITGDFQTLSSGLQIRFAGSSDSATATANNEWEIEVSGANEETHASGAKSVKMSRWKR